MPGEEQNERGRYQTAHQHHLTHIHVLANEFYCGVIEGEAGHTNGHIQAAAKIGRKRQGIHPNESTRFSPGIARIDISSLTASCIRNIRKALAACHAHMAGNGRAIMAAIDDEIMPLRLAANGFVNRVAQKFIALGSA